MITAPSARYSIDEIAQGTNLTPRTLMPVRDDDQKWQHCLAIERDRLQVLLATDEGRIDA